MDRTQHLGGSPQHLKRVEYYPKSPVPNLLSVAEGSDTYELLFSYHHSKRVQLGQAKVYKNSFAIEYISAAMMERSLTIECIGKADKLRTFDLPLGDGECALPLELSSSSKHPLAQSIRAAFKQFPPLPNFDKFADYVPTSVLVQNEDSIIVSTPTGTNQQFQPKIFFNVGEIQDDVVGCLFGPIGCAISVGIAIFLISRTAR